MLKRNSARIMSHCQPVLLLRADFITFKPLLDHVPISPAVHDGPGHHRTFPADAGN